MSNEPSTQWHEEVAPDEDARFGRLVEQLRELQRRNSRRGGAGRALHRKGHVGVEASFEVLDDLRPPSAAPRRSPTVASRSRSWHPSQRACDVQRGGARR